MGCECAKFWTFAKVVPVLQPNEQLRKRAAFIDTPANNGSAINDGCSQQSLPIPLENSKALTTDQPTAHRMADGTHQSSSSLVQRSNLEAAHDHPPQRLEEEASNNHSHSLSKNSNSNDLREDDTSSASEMLAGELLPATTNDCVTIIEAHREAFNPLFLQQRQDAIDNAFYRTTVQSWEPKTLKQLVKSIKRLVKGKSTVDCQWLIFCWIAQHIEYDAASYIGNKLYAQSAEEIFHMRKGLCSGFSQLYKHLSQQLGVECQEIYGHAKGYGPDQHPFSDKCPRRNHVWNAVKIHQHWYLLDVTWGAGHITKQETFERALHSYYFLVRPDQMIYHHLPEDDHWQLLQVPITMKQYLQMPIVRRAYFGFNLELVRPRNQAYASFVRGQPYALVLLRGPVNVELGISLRLDGVPLPGAQRIVFDARKQLHRCYFAPTCIGKHIIFIFAKAVGSTSPLFEEVLHFPFHVDTLPSNPGTYPLRWPDYYALDLEVVSPRNTHTIQISNGAEQTSVVIRAPNAVELLGSLYDSDEQKIVDGAQVYYDQEISLWMCKFTPNRDGRFKAYIHGRNTSTARAYHLAICFPIEAQQITSPPLSEPST